LFWRCAFGTLGCGSAGGVADAAGFLSRWFSAPRGWRPPLHEQLGRAEIRERVGIDVESTLSIFFELTKTNFIGVFAAAADRRAPRSHPKP
jgi:hypothetical protein